MNASRRLALLMLMAFSAPALFAQGKGRESELRTVRGNRCRQQETPWIPASSI